MSPHNFTACHDSFSCILPLPYAQLMRGGPAAPNVEVSATCSDTDCQKVYIKLVNYQDKKANVRGQLSGCALGLICNSAPHCTVLPSAA
jgi:hypothetical protein